MDNLGTPDAQAATAAAAAARADRDRRAPRFSWTPAYEETFFRSLCESVQLGLRENSSFKAEAWERAATALQATHGAYPAKSHLINKSDNARKRFRLWRGLREDPDFMYNPVTRIVKATEEAWKAHIEVTSPSPRQSREMPANLTNSENPYQGHSAAGPLSTKTTWRFCIRMSLGRAVLRNESSSLDGKRTAPWSTTRTCQAHPS